MHLGVTSAQQTADPRKVASASAVGAVIEWYDFFLYGTAAGLVFDQLYFNGLDGPAAQFAAFGTFAVGFVARPVGGLVFGHLGDRVGRKTMLIWTLLIMGVGTAAIGAAADVRPDRRLGARPARGAAGAAGHRRRRGVRRRGAARGRVRPRGAPRVVRQLRPHRRARRALPRLRRVLARPACCPTRRSSAWGWRACFLVSVVLLAIGAWIRLSVWRPRRSSRCRSASTSRPTRSASCCAASRAACCSAWAPGSSRASPSTCSRCSSCPTPSRRSATASRPCSTRSPSAPRSAWSS